MEGTLYSLNRFYKQVISSVCAPVKGTPYEALYYNIGTLDFENRWKKISVQYFAHLLRVPKSGCLYSRISSRWWPVIKKWSRLRWKPTSETAVARAFRSSYIRDNHIYNLIKLAIRCEYSDLRFINYRLKFEDIDHKVSQYVDYTAPWKGIHWERTDFIDSTLIEDRDIGDSDLLIFTDGSVDRLYSGYGFCAFTRRDYLQLINLYSPDEFMNDLPDDTVGGDPVFYQHCSLSARGSIDYCEAMAIFDSVLLLAQKYQDDYLHFKQPPDILKDVECISIITDSQTVLKWLSGIYRIKTLSMKRIIDDILWNVAYLQEAGYNVYFRYAPAHSDVFGNEVADRLAKKGSAESEERANTVYKSRQFTDVENWCYISYSAVNKQIRNLFYEKQQQAFEDHRKKSFFGKVNGDPPPMTRIERKQRLRYFNRLEFRWLIAIHTGHDWFRQHQFLRFRKGNDGICNLCSLDLPQTISHILVECDHDYVMDLRETLRHRVSEIYEESLSIRFGFRTAEYDSAFSQLDWTKCDIFLYNSLVDISTIFEINRYTIRFLSTVKRLFLD